MLEKTNKTSETVLLCRNIGGEGRWPRLRAWGSLLCQCFLITVLTYSASGSASAKDKGEKSQKSERSSSKSEGSSFKSEKSYFKSEKESSKESDSKNEYEKSSSENSNNEGSRERTNRNNSSKNDREENDRDHDDDPPRTLVEMFERMGKQDKPKSSQKTRGGGRSGNDLNHVPHANNEILAVNLSPSGAAHARKLGFGVRGAMHMSNLSGNITSLIPPPGMSAKQARNLLQRDRPNEQFAVNQRYTFYQLARKDMVYQDEHTEPAQHAAACDGDKCFGRQVIRWRKDIQSCVKNLRIGVIDTQIDHEHPAFSGIAIHLGEFLPNGEKPAPSWHGTGVFGLLAGNPNSGTPGLVPQADFYVASIFFQDENGEIATNTYNLLNALEWMNSFDVKIINMSFSGPRDELIEKAIVRMSKQGVIFVAAVGNDGPSTSPSYPAAYDPVVAVTAVNKELRNYPYANRGERIDVAAPGVKIWSAVPNAREGYHTGTSFAVPFVTASIATLYKSGHANKQELLNRLEVIDLGPTGRDAIYGRGLMVAPSTCEGTGKAVAQESEKYQPTTIKQQPLTDKRLFPSSGPANGLR